MENEVLNIENIKRKMLIKYPFFGSAVASIKFKEEKGIQTAGTDGKTIYYNPEFLSTLEENEKTFLVAHEVCHIAFNHVLRSDGKNPKLWNVATDAVINQFLLQDGLPLIKGGVNIEDAINFDAETLYEKLLKEQEDEQSKEQENEPSEDKENNQNQNPDGSNQEENNDVGHDTHSYWDEAVKKHLNGEEEQTNEQENESKLEESQNKMTELGEKESFNKNAKLKDKQLKDLVDSLSKQASQSTASETRETSNIGYNKPLVDWRLWLRESININSDWTYQNAEVEDGVVKPNLETYPQPETEIVLDTSGSIDSELLKNFLRECKNIFKNSKVKVGCFDTKFYGFKEVKTMEEIDKLEYKGGGGTDFNVAVDAFTYRVENRIIFTDGESYMPLKSINAIWIVFGGTKINPPGGKVIYISEEQLRRLRYIDEETSVKSK